MSFEQDITYTDKTGNTWNLHYSVGDYVRSNKGKLVNFKGSVAHLLPCDLENTDEELSEVTCLPCEKILYELRKRHN